MTRYDDEDQGLTICTEKKSKAQKLFNWKQQVLASVTDKYLKSSKKKKDIKKQLGSQKPEHMNNTFT